MEPLAAVRPPQQSRSRASFERVLAAGAELLAAQGYDAFTLAELSQRSGVSIGAIYARVDSKETLVLALHEREMARMADEHAVLADERRWVGLDAAETIEGLVRELSGVMGRNEAILRAFLLRAASDERIAAAGSRASHELALLWEARALTRRTDYGHPDPELAVDVCYRLVYAAFIRRVLHGGGFESERPLSWAQLEDELVAICQGYLGLGR